MAMRACAVALWCAVLVARAAAYTVDCNHEYTDCDTELSKLASEDDDGPLSPTEVPHFLPTFPQTTTAAATTPKIEATTEITSEVTTRATDTPQTTDATESPEAKPKARLLNLNVDELQSFANALHNQTQEQSPKKNMKDLSDVNLDDEEDEPPRMTVEDKHDHNKQISDSFYSNLQAPFNPLLTMGSGELEMCKENGVMYKVGDHFDRGCEESCECMPGGSLDCSPRCKHPFIRRGRRLSDPLCFESPVDDCCSIIACATGNGENKPTKLEVCRYGNDTYPVGASWNIGCEQKCSCEPKSTVTCKPRCDPLPQSDKCINVQDPSDACCEVQVCDVSQDAHEEPTEKTTSTSTTTTTTTTVEPPIKGFEDYSELIKPTMRPLVLTEPIGSIKVLQNNSVQVNLMHSNSSKDPIHLLLSSDGGKRFEDVELKYSNLILNLSGGKDYILKTKETGTKFNFTITTVDQTAKNVTGTDKVGCRHDGHFYAIGEEFHIGCSELCECTGPDTKECVELVCPSHVGLELVSKGCVRWAPSPPPQPPNCCPRTARCLSDGTCHYKGVAIPNWNEVPQIFTGCEERCFCENGELDCQEVCTPLPALPPQTLRCPPGHRPAAVNISDEDCCKQWGCVPNAEDSGSTLQTVNLPFGEPSAVNYMTTIALLPTTTSMPPPPADPSEFYKHLHPVKSYQKISKTVNVPHHNKPQNYLLELPQNRKHLHMKNDNITIFTLDDIDSPFKTIVPETSVTSQIANPKPPLIKTPNSSDPYKKVHVLHSRPRRPPNFVLSNNDMHGMVYPSINKPIQNNFLTPDDGLSNQRQESIKKVPTSKVENMNYFLPSYRANHRLPVIPQFENKPNVEPIKSSQSFFTSAMHNHSFNKQHKLFQNFHSTVNEYKDHKPYIHGNHLTVVKGLVKGLKPHRPVELSSHGINAHILTKAPNPYETVLLRPVPLGTLNSVNWNGKVHSPLDLEHLVRQIEVESELNRNLERSANRIRGATEAGPIQLSSTEVPSNAPRPQKPSFLPTIPPEIHFPQEDDDYENNLPRPVRPLEPNHPGLPPGIPLPPNYGEENKKLTVISLQADSPTSVKLLFGLPPVLVGLRGSVDLRYTDKPDEDMSHWYSQVFAPADEVLTTPRLEFRLTGLKPSTAYKIRGKLYLHNLPVEPESEIYSVRTLDLPTIVEEKRREINSRLTVIDANDTAAHVSWRHFTEDELQFIDGIQVRYRPVGTPIFSMTELLHHSRSMAELHDLRPGSRYEASLVLVPPPRATTELYDPGRVEFTTSPYVDPYNWTVTIEAQVVGSEAAELTWRGVPSPAERWVRVYRAAHACGAKRQEHDAFRLAARDLPPTILLSGLEPDARCRVWLELFLSNGKVKTSNVLEINTKSVDTPADIDNEIEASSSLAGGRGGARGDYYGALVAVGVVAALGALASLLLLLVLVRRHRPRSVPITPVPSAPRESSLPPYDNPAYKLELQQETMDL